MQRNYEEEVHRLRELTIPMHLDHNRASSSTSSYRESSDSQSTFFRSSIFATDIIVTMFVLFIIFS